MQNAQTGNAQTENFATQVANDGWAARGLPPTCAARCPAAGAARARMQSSAGDFGGAPWEAQVLDLDERDLPTESTWDLASSLARSGGDSGVGDAGGSDWVFTGGGESDGDDDDGGVASEGGGLMRAAMQQRPADHGDGDGDGAGDGERAPMRAAKRARPANPVRRAAPVEPAVDPAGTSTSTTNGPYSSVDATPAVPMVAAVAPARSAPAPAPAPAPPPAPAPAPADAAPSHRVRKQDHFPHTLPMRFAHTHVCMCVS